MEMEGDKKTNGMRVMTERPLNAETSPMYLRSWITPNAVFFERNQGLFPEAPIDVSQWRLTVTGEVGEERQFSFEEILRMPKAIVSNTVECSGNGRSLLEQRAIGNPWTTGGVGNAVWGGVWLKEVLDKAAVKASGKHVVFEGFDIPAGSAGIKFVRSIPIEKALSSTLLAYEMNGEALPLKHGYPLRGLALGWTGANCVKWLNRIALQEEPFEGFFMDKVYRIFQKDQDPKTGTVVSKISLKSIITQPLADEKLPRGQVVVLGAAYCGEGSIESVEVSVDGGQRWEQATFIGPNEPYAWRQWQYIWEAREAGAHTLMARATDSEGNRQPEQAAGNSLGYGNNGVREHAVVMEIL